MIVCLVTGVQAFFALVQETLQEIKAGKGKKQTAKKGSRAKTLPPASPLQPRKMKSLNTLTAGKAAEADDASVVSEAVTTPDQTSEPVKSLTVNRSSINEDQADSPVLDDATTTPTEAKHDSIPGTALQPIMNLSGVSDAQKQTMLHPTAACIATPANGAHLDDSDTPAHSQPDQPMADSPMHSNNAMDDILKACMGSGS